MSEVINIHHVPHGDIVVLSDGEYKVMGYVKRFMPTLGRMDNLELIREGDGKRQLFLRGIDVMAAGAGRWIVADSGDKP